MPWFWRRSNWAADRTLTNRLDPLLHERFVLPLLHQLSCWQAAARAGTHRLPLIALNGPVGAGKSTLGRQLEALAPGLGLRLVVASIDDLYLRWPERRARLAGNPFGVTRVPPGSHDLPLLQQALARWRETGILRLPRFDKTLAGGQGDRCGWREEACDALVLEGWLLGCRPLSQASLAWVMETFECATGVPMHPWLGPHDLPSGGLQAPPLQPEEWRWLPHWNAELANYQPIWQACDALWLLRPLNWALPRRWRFQAEARQRRSGGGWLPPRDLDRLVRASLCSLPPALYQDPLMEGLASAKTVFTLQELGAGSPDSASQIPDGPKSGSDRSRVVEHHEPARAETGADRPDGSGTPLEPHNRQNFSDVGQSTEIAGEPGGSRRGSEELGATWTRQATRITHRGVPVDDPPVQGVAWLDGRRRCQCVWLQPSLSLSSSATG